MALTKYPKAQPTHGTFGPLLLQCIGLWSHPLPFRVSCPIFGVISNDLLSTFYSHFSEKSVSWQYNKTPTYCRSTYLSVKMYTQTRPPTTQPKESQIPHLTPHHTRSTGLASGGLPLPSRTNSQASNQAQSHISAELEFFKSQLDLSIWWRKVSVGLQGFGRWFR